MLWKSIFTGQLIESHNQRAGVIGKFSEENTWAMRAVDIREDLATTAYAQDFGITHAEPFQEQKILQDSVLRTQWAEAEKLLFQYQYDLAPFEELF